MNRMLMFFKSYILCREPFGSDAWTQPALRALILSWPTEAEKYGSQNNNYFPCVPLGFIKLFQTKQIFYRSRWTRLGFRLTTHGVDLRRIASTLERAQIPTQVKFFRPFGRQTQVDTSSRASNLFVLLKRINQWCTWTLRGFCDLRADLWIRLTTIWKFVRKFWFCKIGLTMQ